MKVLIIGSGGREHAIAWKIKQSPLVTEVFVAPGNAGMKEVATCVHLTNTNELISFAKSESIALTIVGPEQPLMEGLVDLFQEHGLRIFGPRKNAAQIEGSKQFAKDLMKKYDIPTAHYQVFHHYEQAKLYVEKRGMPIVIKDDGLAQGKGVVVAYDEATAVTALKAIFTREQAKVVIEDYLEGEEFSLLAFVNGEKVFPLIISQDHKRAFVGEKGPNTGGMGAYTPVKQISQEIIEDSVNHIMVKTAKALVQEGCPFTGVLYGGIMSTKDGPKVIEFNARFGDPETEVILPRLNSDLFVLIERLLDGEDIEFDWKEEATIGIVLASCGYPNQYEKGYEIKGLDEIEDCLVFHMGTKTINNKVLTNGGRVLIIVGKEKSLYLAKEKVLANIKKINCDNLFYRHDIGYRSLNDMEAEYVRPL